MMAAVPVLQPFFDFLANAWTQVVKFWSGLSEGEATAIQAAVVGGGGLWAYIQYRRRREFQATVRIETAAKVGPNPAGGRRLFLRLHLVNESSAFIDVSALATLMVVTPPLVLEPVPLPPPRARPVVVVLAKQDALAFVYGQPEVSELRPNGHQLADEAGEEGEMEPGECIETELLFAVPEDLGLLAVRLSVEGFRRRWWAERWVRDSWNWVRKRDPGSDAEWDAFAYLNLPELEGTEFVPIGSPHG